MSKSSNPVCADPTEEISIRIPCALAERVTAYAKVTRSSISSVVVEALDFFLRRQNPP